MQLIIIQGESGSGKTTLAKQLARDLQLSVFFKDAYKERRYDELGHIPNLWCWFIIEKASWRELHRAVKTAIANNTSLIIEGHFLTRQKHQIRQFLTDRTSVIEIYCQAPSKVILQRFKSRSQRGDRHKGHRDNVWYPLLWLEVTMARMGWHWIRPLRLSEHTLLVETTDISKINYENICQYIAANSNQ